MRQHTGFIYLEKVLIITLLIIKRQTNVCKPKVIGTTKGFESPLAT